MRKPQSSVVVLLAGALLLSAPAGGALARSAVHRIIIDKMAFGPAPNDVHAGDTIEWVNRDIFQHSATASDKSFDVDLPPDATGKTGVWRPGTIDYVCKYHPGMKGRIIVLK